MLSIVFFSCYSNANTQTSKKRDCLNGGFVCIENKDGSKILVVNSKEYPAVSYYESVSIVGIDASNFQVINDYDYSSPITIYSYFTIKNKIVYLKSIQTLSFSNTSPRGARKECKAFINSIYNKPLEYYVDGTVLSEDKKIEKKICAVKKN